MRFAQLVKAHGARYRHTVIALDNILDMAARIAQDLAITYRAVDFDKRDGVRNLWSIHRVMEETAPDVLVTYNWGAIEWALVNRIWSRRRHVHIEDGFGPEEATRQLRRRIWARRLSLAGKHTNVVLPSRGLQQIALHVWKLPPERVQFVPNGIDCRRFRVDMAQRLKRASHLVVGTVATLRTEKNIPRLIAAFGTVAAAFPPGSVQLIIVGDGPERTALESLAHRMAARDQIRFIGATNTPEDWYREMDVFALSSDTEQMPLSILEAMAAGLPVVSPAVGDIPSLVATENRAQIVTVGNENGYRDALAAVLRDEGLRLKLGDANQRKAVAEFDAQVMTNRYAEIFG